MGAWITLFPWSHGFTLACLSSFVVAVRRVKQWSLCVAGCLDYMECKWEFLLLQRLWNWTKADADEAQLHSGCVEKKGEGRLQATPSVPEESFDLCGHFDGSH